MQNAPTYLEVPTLIVEEWHVPLEEPNQIWQSVHKDMLPK